jgi:hypothetical protein
VRSGWLLLIRATSSLIRASSCAGVSAIMASDLARKKSQLAVVDQQLPRKCCEAIVLDGTTVHGLRLLGGEMPGRPPKPLAGPLRRRWRGLYGRSDCMLDTCGAYAGGRCEGVLRRRDGNYRPGRLPHETGSTILR